MSVRAVLADGSEVELAARYGETVEEAAAALTSTTLTGSAVPLADASVEAADGRSVAFSEIERLVDGTLF